ncbi:MAG: hypothetical protein EAZ53_02455 [Bacteroidetes bacterium]|nr:MAG: hypothetical protein EAZ53_02455 [Bacteroidota bacterium]
MKNIALFIFLFNFCIAQEKISQVMFDNASQEGINGQSTILMHNRKGIRIEHNINRQKLVLWISPLAGKSLKGFDRNFSNRDDQTSIFDRIGFPNLPYENFIKCDYDAFHSVVHFKTNKLHILSVFDKQAVIIWFENNEIIDIKTDKIDKILKKSTDRIVTEHIERGHNLNFAAILGKGNGNFTHQKVEEFGRSHYSRISITANQLMVFSADANTENIENIAETLANTPIEKTILDNEQKINLSLSNGSIKVNNNPDLQKVINLNKRIILSMQDESGAMRAALRYIYYLIWHRDGGMVFSYNAYTGWAAPLEKWLDFILANPTTNAKGEKYFGQLVSQITKEEEDGPFYGIWSAFTFWTQTGNAKFLAPKYMSVLDDNIKWLENNYYDKKKGMFFRYHYCESPFYKSPGDGFDDACGKPGGNNVSMYAKDTISMAYDQYINSICYSNYVMMSAMSQSPKKEEYMAKAKKLGEKCMNYYEMTKPFPAYGLLITNKGKEIIATEMGMDETDHIWGLTVPPFLPYHADLQAIRGGLYERQMENPKNYFLSGYFANIAGMDSYVHGQDKLIKAIEYIVPQAVRGGKCLPMPYTIPEIVDVEDCNVYHDVRPQPFSITSMLAAISNLGVRRSSFGIGVRANTYLSAIEKYSYKNSEIDIKFSGTGDKIKAIFVNNKPLFGTLQIPENLLVNGKNTIQVIGQNVEIKKPIWVESTVKLLAISGTSYQIEAFGKNTITFANTKSKITIIDAKGNKIVPILIEKDKFVHIEFEGTGKFVIKI